MIIIHYMLPPGSGFVVRLACIKFEFDDWR